MGVKVFFDTANRLITVTEVPVLAPGQTVAQQTLDIEVDFYSDAKEDWETNVGGNYRKNVFPFITAQSAGQALPGGQVEPAFFRLRNDEGWRILPYDSDHELTLLGNIVPNDESLPIFQGRPGRSILVFRDGSQVAQMTSETVGEAVDLSPKVQDLHGQVARAIHVNTDLIDVGTGYHDAPYNNLTDAIDDAEISGITTLRVAEAIIFDRNVRNFRVEGIGLPEVDTAGFDLKGTSFYQVQLKGIHTSEIIVQESVFLDNSTLCGYAEKCVFAGNVALTGHSHIVGSSSGIPGSGYMVFDTGDWAIQITEWRRSLGITNMTSGIHTIEMYGGQLHLDATCTGGTIYLRGDYSTPPDDQATGTLIIDQTETKRLIDLDTAVADVDTIVTSTETKVDTLTTTVNGIDTKVDTIITDIGGITGDMTVLNGQVEDLWQFKGLDAINSIARSGDGVTSEVLTVNGKVLTITPTTITRS